MVECVKCNKKSSSRCKVCQTPYCGRKCQKEDWHLTHKFICHAPGDFQLPYILKGIIEKDRVLKSKKLKFLGIYKYINLSNTNLEYFEDSKLIDFKAFKIGGREIEFRSKICCVCGNVVDYRGPLKDVKQTIIIDNQELEYYRCIACNNANKKICSRSLMETSKCGFYVKQRFMDFLLCIEQWMIPKDIIYTIFLTYRKIICNY